MTTTFLRLLALLSMAVMLLDAAPAAAQYSSRLKEKSEAIDPGKARELQRDFAQCVYKSKPQAAERLLRNSDFMNVDDAALDTSSTSIERALDMEDCFEDVIPIGYRKMEMGYSPAGLRKLLTEAAYLANRKRPFAFAADEPVFLTTRTFVPGEGENDAKILAGFADCVVHSAPVQADALVRTKPGSKDEAAAIQAIVPSLGPCLDDGNDIKLSVETVRALIADGLWARIAYGSASSR